MPIPILSTFRRQGEGNYPLLSDGDVKGGFQVVNSAAERDAIPSNLRKAGMHVHVAPETTTYYLEADLTIWTPVPSGGGGEPNIGFFGCSIETLAHDVVYLLNADQVAPADSDDHLKQPVIGFVKQKLTDTTCKVQYSGELSSFSDLIAGATYYLWTTPGQISTVPPSDEGNIIQRVGFAKNATTMVVMVDRDYQLL